MKKTGNGRDFARHLQDYLIEHGVFDIREVIGALGATTQWAFNQMEDHVARDTLLSYFVCKLMNGVLNENPWETEVEDD